MAGTSLPTTTIVNPSQFTYAIPQKLAENNFLLWKKQMLSIIKGHMLMDYFDGIILLSGPDIAESEIALRKQQDQLLLAWVLSSLTAPVMAQVLQCETTAEVWKMIHNLYASRSQSRILELKIRLQTVRKGGLDCGAFLARIQELADELRSRLRSCTVRVRWAWSRL